MRIYGVGQVLRLELINDLAYSMKSHQEIAEIHGLSLEGIFRYQT
jgi:hypothetical protein